MVEVVGNVIKINLKREVDDSYDIIFGEALFPQIALYLADDPSISKCAIITDSNVRRFHAGNLEDALKAHGLNVTTFSFEAGEQNKTRKTSDELTGLLLQNK